MMKRKFGRVMCATALCLVALSGANAAVVSVSSDISVSTTWTADNVYRLTQQIYVLPGATLTIEPGTVVASSTGVGGSLAVSRGARIFVNGTEEEPVIMTSTADVATWTPSAHPSGGDPKTGTWREGVNEWGNLTLMGNGLISASHFKGAAISVTTDDDQMSGGSTTTRVNTKIPDGLNQKQMEGLTASFPGDARVLYGGNDDDDDSGSIGFLSIRYGGKVIGLGNELNGLSLGGIGRETDIHHVEIMNNVDDGIEIWGGTVNLKCFSIWNIGDDSLDVDQGWRGKAQFGLIVQGYSADADQGSGVGDNCIETDGAEDSDAQPVTTSTIYNVTVVGQPIDGDGGTTWRDNARIQYRNCIFMDLGEKLVRPDGDDGDGAQGYGYNGTLSFADTWTTDAGTHSTINAATTANPGDFNHPDTLYTVQTTGKLAEIKDSVFYNNLHASAYTDADLHGVRAAANNNVTATVSPIKGISRGGAVTRGGLTMVPVTNIDPRAAGDAVSSVDVAPNDGFFSPACYRGGFDPYHNWLQGWTAADAFGLTSGPTEVLVSADIVTSVTWTNDNIYNLQNQIYVLPGATLTIEEGTIVRSTAGIGGSLAVSRGARIFVNGTKEAPVIMTSTKDDMKTWHEGVNEWGNLTLMGNGLISASHFKGSAISVTVDDDQVSGGSTTTRQNTKIPDGLNQKQMEGLTAAFPGDSRVLYGGSDDDDDSGSINFLSIRYGGKVIGLGNELNGLSLGAIGRETDIDYVEIMNNVDDGIEIWGGTVNLKHFSIWNVGDDSLDVDQGWRGKAQYGLIVQGYSADADQGSGVGDNCIETDGAEDSDAQPVTTSTIYNVTVVGQPIDGDGGTAWRDNARVQYRNCVFMDLGEKLVRPDGDDGDGAQGYGYQGTLSFADTWTTDAGVHSMVNAATMALPGDFNHPDTLYTVQVDGKLAEIKDSVFFRNLHASAYTDADTHGVRNPSNNNVTAAQSPIKKIERAEPVTRGGLTMVRVTDIDPRAWNDAVAAVDTAPNDGFFVPAKQRGGFTFYDNWLEKWSAAYTYGLTDTSNNLSQDELGDVGSTSGTTITDALLIAQLVAGLRTPDDPAFTNLTAGDVNGVGGITITDALLIGQFATGLRSSLGKKLVYSNKGTAPSVSIDPASIVVDPNQTGSFQIRIDSGSIPVGAYDIDLSWMAGFLTIDSVDAGSSTEFGAPVANIDNANGLLTITGFQVSSLTEPTGSFTIATVNFTAAGGGATTLDLTVQEMSDTDGSLLSPTSADGSFTVNTASSVANWMNY